MKTFLEWLNEGQIPINKINDAIIKTIQFLLNGKWQVLNNAYLTPAYWHQRYGVVEMYGNDVKWQGDRCYIKVFFEIKRQTGDILPMSDPNVNPYSDFEKVHSVDPHIGHRLLLFRGFVKGWKPGTARKHPTLAMWAGDDEEERLGEFESLTTPSEVAERIQQIISNWGFEGGGDRSTPFVPNEPELALS